MLVRLTCIDVNSDVTMEPSGVLQLCPGSSVTFSCTNNQTQFIFWGISHNSLPDGPELNPFSSGDVGMPRFVKNFTFVLISTNPLVSTVTFTNKFNPQQNGTTLVCTGTLVANPSASLMDDATLILKGILYAVSLSVCVCIVFV